MRRVIAPASPGAQLAPRPPDQSGALGGSRQAASRSEAGQISGAGSSRARAGRPGEGRLRQARQNAVKTLKGWPASVFTSHGSNSRLALRLSAATPRWDNACFKRVSRSREPLIVDAVPVDRAGIAFGGQGSDDLLGRSAAQDQREPRPCRKASSDCRLWCSHQRAAAPGRRVPSVSSSST